METWDDGARRLLTLKISPDTAQTWRSTHGWSFSSKCGFDRLALLVHRGAVYRSTGVCVCDCFSNQITKFSNQITLVSNRIVKLQIELPNWSNRDLNPNLNWDLPITAVLTHDRSVSQLFQLSQKLQLPTCFLLNFFIHTFIVLIWIISLKT